MAITVQYPSKVYPSPFSKKAAVSKFAAAPAGARHLILSWGDNAPQKQRKDMEKNTKKTQVSTIFGRLQLAYFATIDRWFFDKQFSCSSK
jgi:hypothetical protein